MTQLLACGLYTCAFDRSETPRGIVIPKPLPAQLGLDAKSAVEMTIEDGALVLRQPASPPRTRWAEAARSIAEAGHDELVVGEFANEGDSELVW